MLSSQSLILHNYYLINFLSSQSALYISFLTIHKLSLTQCKQNAYFRFYSNFYDSTKIPALLIRSSCILYLLTRQRPITNDVVCILFITFLAHASFISLSLWSICRIMISYLAFGLNTKVVFHVTHRVSFRKKYEVLHLTSSYILLG